MSSSPARRARRAAAGRKTAAAGGTGGRNEPTGSGRPVKSATRSLPPRTTRCEQMLWRQLIAEMSAPMPMHWFGNDPRWREQMEADARSIYGNTLTATEMPGRQLVYRVPLDVRGPTDLVDVAVMFAAYPRWDTYGLPARDYPRVWAEPGRASKHRMPDDALCLWFPDDPEDRRWTSAKGLADLLNLVVDHLIAEKFWRATGAGNGGQWMFDEAEHGFPAQAAAA